jgi:hypothetical protein
MKILSDLTVEEQSEEEIERFRRRSLINREEYSARKIQRYFRLKLGSEKSLFATNYSTNSSKLRSDSELRKLGRSAREQPRNSYYSANPRRRARFKNLSLNVSVNAGVNDCLPSRDAAAEHELIMKLESDGIVLCKNGEPGPLCRRFRSEVFQESFLQESSTFSIPEFERKLFRSALQQSHPIYRMMAVKLDECNIRHRARCRVKYWIRSFIELFHYGKVKQQQKSGVSLFLRSKVTQSNQRKLLVLSKQSQLLRCNAVTTEAYDFDMAEPLSKPVALYQPREYLPSEIREFFLTDTGEVNSDVSQNSSSHLLILLTSILLVVPK